MFVGNTALHWAAARGNLEATQRLIEHGASIASLNVNAKTPFALADRNHHEAITAFLQRVSVTQSHTLQLPPAPRERRDTF